MRTKILITLAALGGFLNVAFSLYNHNVWLALWQLLAIGWFVAFELSRAENVLLTKLNQELMDTSISLLKKTREMLGEIIEDIDINVKTKKGKIHQA